MAKASAAPKTVKLTAPDGTETSISDPVSLSSLHFGSGYKLPKGMSYADAEAALQGAGDELLLVNADAPGVNAPPPDSGSKSSK